MIREASPMFSDDRLPGDPGGPQRKKRIAVLLAMALVAGLVAMAGTATTGAQTSTGTPSLVVSPSSVSAPGTYDFTLTPSGFTAADTNLAICSTADPDIWWDWATFQGYCDGFGSPADNTGPIRLTDVEVGADGVTFWLFELTSDGESAAARVEVVSGPVTFSGTVTAEGGASTDSVMVAVAAQCWDSCGVEELPNDGSGRPRPLEPVAFLGQTSVDSSGQWSVTVSGGVRPRTVRSVLVVVWDTDGQLASRLTYHWIQPELWDWESRSGIDVELEAGGRVSGRFASDAGGPPSDGDYGLISDEWADLALDVDPQTGAFISPAVAPGEYSLAHGNHGDGYLANNAAASITITAGQTTDASTVEIQQTGGIAGTVTDTDGRPLGGIRVIGQVTSQNPYRSMPGSPFNLNGSSFFGATTNDDGTYTADSLVPGNDWQVTFAIPLPVPFEYTAIAKGYAHSCAIQADQTIDCWGSHYSGKTDAPDGQYTAIAAGDQHSCAIRTDQAIDCWGNNKYGETDAPEGQYTAIAAAGVRHSCAIRADNQAIDCWGDNQMGQPTPLQQVTAEGIAVVSSKITTGVDYPVTDYGTETDDTDDSTDTDDSAAQQCFAHHQFGAEPVDVAKTADRQTVLAQLSWGYHDSIGCYLTLDPAALSALRAAAAPWGFPAGDPEVAQQCSAVHKFGAQPVDVAKTADKQTVLAQVRWGYHDSIGCYLTLDEASIATLRAAHT